MSVCFYKQHCRQGEFDQDFIDNFFKQYPFIPMKELIYSVEEDKKRIFISYNTDRIKNIGDMPDTRNIWCFDKKTGERLWVIEQEKGNNPRVFNAASFHEDWILRVSTTQGLTYDLDPETGKISNPVFTK